MMEGLKRRKSISEMLGVIILLALVVVAGAFVYTVFFGRANTLANSPSIEIESASIQGGVLTITVKNTGTTALSGITVSIYSPGSSSAAASGSISGTLSPGATGSGTITFTETPGTTYTVVVQATPLSGGSVSASTQVIGE